jgi:Ser/Thr protein kinase RdoA (MazF antagonist)
MAMRSLTTAQAKPDVSSSLPPDLHRRCRPVVGDVAVVSRHDQPHRRANVWRLESESGPCFLKQHGEMRRWAAEVHALTAWAPALYPEAPQLRAAWDGSAAAGERPAVLVTALPGAPLSSLTLDAAQQQCSWNAAGAWLARWHALPPGRCFGGTTADGKHPSPDAEADAVALITRTIEDWLARGRDAGVMFEAETATAMRALGATDVFASEVPMPCHGDFQPHNWIIDGTAAWSGVIDFEHARWDVRLADLGLWWDRLLAGRPDRQEALFAGYGRRLNAREAGQLAILRALGAMARIVGGHRAGQTAVVQLGRRTLADIAAMIP